MASDNSKKSHNSRSNSSFELHAMPDSVLDIITSYLHFSSLKALIKASNRNLRHKLLVGGGISTINIFPTAYPVYNPSSYYNFVPRLSFGLPPVPTRQLSATDLGTGAFPPKSFLPRVRSLRFQDDRFSPMTWPSVRLVDLPPTLTHLDWSMIADRDVQAKEIKIAEYLPALQSLMLRFDWQGPPSNPASLVLENLPTNLTSLALEVFSSDEILRAASVLPPTLTELALFEHVGAFSPDPVSLPLSMDILAVPLPRSITILQLPQRSFILSSIPSDVASAVTSALVSSKSAKQSPASDLPDLSTWYGAVPFFSLPLTALTLGVVHPYLRPFLPSTLTHLTMTKAFNPQDVVQHSKWPASLRRLVIGEGKGLCVASEPQLTSIGVLYPRAEVLEEYLVSKCLVDGQAFAGILELDFPGTVLLESYLDLIPPRILKVTLLDVMIQGQCLPKDLKHLDDAETLVTHFWRVKRHFRLYLRAWEPLVHRYRIWPSLSPKLRSLRLPKHNLTITDLPPRLKCVDHLNLSVKYLSQLPPGLTDLGISDTHKQEQLDVEDLLLVVPKLKTLRGAHSIQLREKHFPAHLLSASATPRSSSNAAATAAAASSSSSAPQQTPDKPPKSPKSPKSSSGEALPSVTLPQDAEEEFQRQHPDLELINCRFAESFLLAKVQRFPVVSSATFHGDFSISQELIKEGFASGLVVLDMRTATFLPVNDYFPVMPTLPKTLRELHLGGRTAEQLIYPTSNRISSVIPNSITHLTLNVVHPKTQKPWQFPPLTSLLHLEIRTEFNKICEQNLEAIPNYLTDRTLSGDGLGIVALAEAKSNCVLM